MADVADTDTLEVTDQVNREFQRLMADVVTDEPTPELEQAPAPPDDDPPLGGDDSGDKWILVFYQYEGAPIAVYNVTGWTLEFDTACCDAHGVYHYRCDCEANGTEWVVFVPADRVRAFIVRSQP